jgi:adenylate cyclase
MRLRLHSPLLAAAVASALAFAAVYGLRLGGALEGLELAFYDWHIRHRPAATLPAPRVVLVSVTEKDIQDLGTWPLSDALLAEVLETVSRAGARAIGLDVYRDTPVPPGHERLNAVLKNHSQIIAPTLLPQDGKPGVPPPAALKESDRIGFTDVVVDPGGTVRRGLLLMDDGQRVFYSLPLRLALLYLQAEGVALSGDPEHPSYLRLGRTTFRPLEPNDGSYVRADAGGYQFLLDYRDPPDVFPSVTLSELRAGQVGPGLFKGKVVLVGVTAESVKDSFYTPYGQAFGEKKAMYGVVLIGHAVSQLLRAGLEGDAPTAVIDDTYEALWVLLWSLLGGAAALLLRSAWRFVLVMLGVLALLALAVHALFVLGLWIPLVPPALAWIGAGGLASAYLLSEEKRERASLMGLFSSYMSRQLADEIWRHRDDFLSGGRPRPQKLTATIFFSDVVNFTTVSEQLDPQTLMDWFYEFMATVTPLVSEHGGVILRFLGDAIMAAFGAPIVRTHEKEIARDAVNAVDCALAVQGQVIALNRRLEQRGWPLVSMRIGILTGPVVAGSIGSAARLEYNLHGDTVNTASRLESFDKEGFAPDYFSTPCRILVGESTLRLLGGEFHTEWLGEVQLKGKMHPTRIHRVHGRRAAGEAPRSA